jgi:hypothetical protein
MARIEKQLKDLVLFLGLALVLLVSSCPTDVDVSAPDVPTGLVVTTVSSSQINIVWNASTDDVGVAGYKIFRGGAYLKTVASGTSTSDTGLSASTQYCYCVSAYDAANNESARCTQLCATTHANGKPEPSWQIKVVDTSGHVGRYTSIALDSNGYPHISYADETSYNLKYVHWIGSSWDGLDSLAGPDAVDTTGHVGRYTSIALDSNGYPHISYADETSYNLKYARYGE